MEYCQRAPESSAWLTACIIPAARAPPAALVSPSSCRARDNQPTVRLPAPVTRLKSAAAPMQTWSTRLPSHRSPPQPALRHPAVRRVKQAAPAAAHLLTLAIHGTPPSHPFPHGFSCPADLNLGCFADPYCSNGHTQTAMGVITPKPICYTIKAGRNPFGGFGAIGFGGSGTSKTICLPVVPVTDVAGCADLAFAYNYRYFIFQSSTCYASNSTAYAVSAGTPSACYATCYKNVPFSIRIPYPCPTACTLEIYQVGLALPLHKLRAVAVPEPPCSPSPDPPQVDYPVPVTPAVPAPPPPPPVSCSSSLSCLMSYSAMDADGASFPDVSSHNAGTSERCVVACAF